MPCYSPLRAYGVPDVDGKLKIDFVKPLDYKKYDDSSSLYKILIPCGQCIGCRLEYSRQWAIRCVLEASQYDHNYFVTLTYDDDHIPLNFKVHEDDTVSCVSSLKRKDVQDFLKRLRSFYKRKFFHDNIRYFGCGEYGDKYSRPHYHMVFFNLPIPDLKLVEKSKNGCSQFESAVLSSLWKNGIVRISEVNFQTCAYTARYMLKKHKGQDSDFYSKNHISPEFSMSSRRPGIGKGFYDVNLDKIYSMDNITLPNGVVTKPPKYFDKLFDVDYHSQLVVNKNLRKDIAQSKFEFELMNTTKEQFDYLLDKAVDKTSRVKALVRDL